MLSLQIVSGGILLFVGGLGLWVLYSTRRFFRIDSKLLGTITFVLLFGAALAVLSYLYEKDYRTCRLTLENQVEQLALTESKVWKGVSLAFMLSLFLSVIAYKVHRWSLIQMKELTAAREEMRIARDNAQSAHESKSSLLGVVAHDLKNPLNAISSMSQILLEDFSIKRDKEIHQNLKLISDGASHMYRLVNELLLSEGIENSFNKANPQKVDFGKIVRKCIDYNCSTASLKEIQIESYIEDDLIINADCDQIQRAIDNLLGNAVKYSGLGMKIKIRAEKLDSKKMVKFSVSDRGPGISEEDQKILFKKYQRVSATPTGGESSFGLGLYIVKSIIEKNGGKVGLESEIGKGSTFWFIFPLA